MRQNKTRWVLRPGCSQGETLTDLNALKDRLLQARGVDPSEQDAFLNPSLAGLTPWDNLQGLTPAVLRLKSAMAAGERIVVYGDYDVDGMTSISILVRTFRHLGHPVDYYIPDRMEEGYGLNSEAIRGLISSGAKVIVTVDCGITSTLEAQICREAGVDLIITDHHEPHAQLPEAFAVVNPKQAQCAYPYKHLAGAGIALRLAEALLGDRYAELRTSLLELAAFGTVADVAPLLGENRILVYHGLATMADTDIPGLKALIEATEMTGKRVTAGHIGFILGPKLNAAGRIADAMLGVKLLITEDVQEAKEIALKLVDMNAQRQAIELEIVEAAIAQVEAKRGSAPYQQPLPAFLVVSGEGWHSGVIGIVASRIVERYHRPVIVFGVDQGIAKGSGRSIEGFNLFECLQSVSDLFDKFGGHEQAAGMTLAAGKLGILEERLTAYATDRLTAEDFKPLYPVEAILAKEAIRFELTDLLKKLEPYGVGNPKPLFRVNDLITEKVMTIGRVKTYLKVLASDGLRNFDLINFKHSEIFEPLKSKMRFDALVAVEENEFRGVRSIQFDTRDLRILDPALHFETEDLERFARLKAEAIIHQAYELQPVSRSKRTGAKKGPEASETPEMTAINPKRFVAYSLQGWLAYCHRWMDRPSGEKDPSHEFFLCPALPPEDGHSLDPPDLDLRKEAASLIPGRDQLKRVYLTLRDQGTPDRPLTLETLLALRILESAGLIKATGDLKYQLCPVSAKVDLTASPLFSALNLWVKGQGA